MEEDAHHTRPLPVPEDARPLPVPEDARPLPVPEDARPPTAPADLAEDDAATDEDRQPILERQYAIPAADLTEEDATIATSGDDPEQPGGRCSAEDQYSILAWQCANLEGKYVMLEQLYVDLEIRAVSAMLKDDNYTEHKIIAGDHRRGAQSARKGAKDAREAGALARHWLVSRIGQ